MLQASIIQACRLMGTRVASKGKCGCWKLLTFSVKWNVEAPVTQA